MPITEPLKKLIKGRQWYHQRFDGSPMFLFAVGEAEVKKEKRKPTGTEANVRVCYFSHGKADWYLDMADINRGARVIIKLAKKDPNISTKLLKVWRKDEQKFEDFFWKRFPKINLQKLTDSELLKLWNKYYQLYIKRFTSSAVIDHFALGTDEIIAKMLRKEAPPSLNPSHQGRERKKTDSSPLVGEVRRGGEREFTEIFSTATAPVHQSFINQAEIDLLKIVTGQSKMSLAEYQKQYFWTKNNYVLAQNLTVSAFQREIKAWKQSGKDLKEELKRIQETPRINKLNKQKLFKKFHLSRLLRTLLTISEDFTWWQDERKKSTYFNTHIGTEMLKVIARRIGCEVEELKYAVAREIPGILMRQRPTRRELQARRKNSVFILNRQGYQVVTGRKVEQIREIMLGSEDYSDIKDIRGLSASLGRVIGTVRVVRSATEVSKVKVGDILVAVMTRPDYVTAMKKAAAIVTNEGGITSHAAIVSRELGIPCIIGTKIATQVFKDGDMVEVNANHGWVRKLTK